MAVEDPVNHRYIISYHYLFIKCIYSLFIIIDLWTKRMSLKTHWLPIFKFGTMTHINIFLFILIAWQLEYKSLKKNKVRVRRWWITRRDEVFEYFSNSVPVEKLQQMHTLKNKQIQTNTTLGSWLVFRKWDHKMTIKRKAPELKLETNWLQQNVKQPKSDRQQQYQMQNSKNHTNRLHKRQRTAAKACKITKIQPKCAKMKGNACFGSS